MRRVPSVARNEGMVSRRQPRCAEARPIARQSYRPKHRTDPVQHFRKNYAPGRRGPCLQRSRYRSAAILHRGRPAQRESPRRAGSLTPDRMDHPSPIHLPHPLVPRIRQRHQPGRRQSRRLRTIEQRRGRRSSVSRKALLPGPRHHARRSICPQPHDPVATRLCHVHGPGSIH